MTPLDSVQGSSLESLVAEVADDFVARQQRGEEPDIENYAARHPHLAAVLRQVLTGLQLVRQSAAGLASGGAEASEVSGVLGDFRIVREVGRGGMGVVYEAEQVSLGRRVALKVLPYAGMLDPRQLQRFQNEARAAACLHHTNIVPVHFVGSERGVHFYAMQFIEGQTLAALIGQQRQAVAPEDGTTAYQPPGVAAAPAAETVVAARPATRSGSGSKRGREDFRRLAELGVQAAEALDHAHQAGIVHRDVKPANLMIDTSGRLWVTDFGLAQVQSDARLTLTGDLVGTLRYMSPEQALAKRVVVDHRSDIYSLGATLYELLTLQPPVTGEDRQELLRQIAFEEPARPRRLAKAVPAELETIVLKAMEKNPADRYATAQELADDLERFVKDEPIRARRPSLVQRARKWARRHPAVLRSTLAIVFLAVLGLALGTYLIWQEKTRKEVALELAEERRETAEKAQKAAEQAKRRTRAVLHEMSSDVIEEWLAKQIELTPEQRGFLERTLAHYESFTLETGETPEERAFLAEAHGRVARIRSQLGLNSAAEKAFRRSIDLGVQLLTNDPNLEGIRHLLAANRFNLGILLNRQGRKVEAVTQLRAALEIKQGLVRDFPRIPKWWISLANTYSALGEIDLPERAEEHHRQAVAILEKLVAERPNDAPIQSALGGALHDLSLLERRHGGLLETRRLLEAAVSHQEAAVKANPRNVQYRNFSRNHYMELGSILARLSELREAEKAFERAKERAEALAADYPRIPQERSALAWVYREYGELLIDMQQPQKAENVFRQALSLLVRLVKECPDIPDYGVELVATVDRLAMVLVQRGRFEEIEKILRNALEEASKFAPGYPEVMKNQVLATILLSLGNFLRQKGDRDGAIDQYERALRLKPDYAEVRNSFGNALKDKGQLDEAIAEYRKALRIKPDFAQAHNNLGNGLTAKGELDEAMAEYREAFRLKKNFAEAHNNLGIALYDTGRLDEAIAEYREALRLKKDYAAPHNNLGNALADKGRRDEAIAEFRKALRLKKDYAEPHNNLGNALRHKGRLDEAIAEYQEAIRLKKDFANAHANLSEVLREKGRLDEAIMAHREAVKLKPTFAPYHSSYGVTLVVKGRLDEAIGKFRKALQLQKDYPDAHKNLWVALRAKGDMEGAIAAYREAIRIKKDFAEAHYNLGVALAEKGQLDEAITAYRAAIRHKPDYAEAHCNLGACLQDKGQFIDALAARRRGHELGSQRQSWDFPSEQWVKQCERLVKLDSKLPRVLRGEVQPADGAERLALAEFCQLPCKSLHAAAARFYAAAFAEQPKLADDLKAQHRYDAARAAALAGCGQGKDVDQSDARERARLRCQALDWLRADLAAYRQMLDKEPEKTCLEVRKQMQHWLQDTDFAGVRGSAALAKLPNHECQKWQQLWADVAETLARTERKAAPKPLPQPRKESRRGGRSLDLVDRTARVARYETLALAVHQQVEVFQDNRADQGCLAPGFHDGLEGAIPTDQLDVDSLHLLTLCPSAVGVTDLDFLAQGQSQLLGHGLRQHQPRRSGIHDAGNALPPHLRWLQQAPPRHFQVAIIGHLELNADSPHAGGSVVWHGTAPFTVAMPEKAS